ncbi:pyridoxamine 5'-phosphate oxidase family protein [Lentisphaera profundi]|uniref:pyridoxamine 5'-phosphate oxidase family protein n=1 Tax=Lentisphaera profundi TaxID=1658616 RepID=UPI003B683FC6
MYPCRRCSHSHHFRNFHFNTFGNFLTNPKAGLFFIDFKKGHLLTLTGRLEVLWSSPEIKKFNQA